VNARLVRELGELDDLAVRPVGCRRRDSNRIDAREHLGLHADAEGVIDRPRTRDERERSHGDQAP
jgi:hypothetical protein